MKERNNYHNGIPKRVAPTEGHVTLGTIINAGTQVRKNKSVFDATPTGREMSRVFPDFSEWLGAYAIYNTYEIVVLKSSLG